jgi:hypothetical protein
MGRTPNMHKEDENTYTISLRIPEERSIILTWILNRYIMGSVYQIHLAQDRTSERLL